MCDDKPYFLVVPLWIRAVHRTNDTGGICGGADDVRCGDYRAGNVLKGDTVGRRKTLLHAAAVAMACLKDPAVQSRGH